MIVEISDRDLSQFQELICNRSGIHLDNDSLGVLRSQIHERMELNGFTRYAQYYNFLCFHPSGQSELEELLSHITVNETYFFMGDTFL